MAPLHWYAAADMQENRGVSLVPFLCMNQALRPNRAEPPGRFAGRACKQTRAPQNVPTAGKRLDPYLLEKEQDENQQQVIDECGQ